MKVYLVYDCYDNGEWFEVHHVCRSMVELRKTYKQDILDFIMYGPDDLHSFQCQVVNVTSSEYELLKEYELKNTTPKINVDDPKIKETFNDLMSRIFDELNDNNFVFGVDYDDDISESVDYYISMNKLDPNDKDNILDQMYDDDDFFRDVVKTYIDDTYHL